LKFVFTQTTQKAPALPAGAFSPRKPQITDIKSLIMHFFWDERLRTGRFGGGIGLSLGVNAAEMG
jgi:hypothetical protein